MGKLDFDPLFDNQRWEDRPAKDPVIINREHEETKLDRRLEKSSKDNRKTLMYLHTITVAVIVVLAIIAVISLLVWGFNFSFGSGLAG